MFENYPYVCRCSACRTELRIHEVTYGVHSRLMCRQCKEKISEKGVVRFDSDVAEK